MKRILFGLIAGVFAVLPLAEVAQATEVTASPGLVIRQAYFGSPTDASDEFIIITNTALESVDIGGYTIEYKSAKGKNWYRKAEVPAGVMLAGGQEYVFATKREHDAELSNGFAQAAGNARVVSGAGETVDALAWGSGDSPEAQTVAAPRQGEALARKLDTAGALIDTQVNAADFEIANIDRASEEVVTPDSSVTLPVQVDADVAIELTEVFPDPASPASDSSDEFIELFNVGAEPAVLNGWKLRDAAGHMASLDGVSLVSGQYLALMSSQTKLSLNNAGDTIALINPAGETVMTSPDYGAAKEGLTYGSSDEGWGWLATPTSNAANSSLARQDVVAAATTKAKAKKASVKSTKKKAKSAKAKTPKLAKTASAATVNAGADQVEAQAESIPWTWLVAGLGVLAVGYGVYEYRPEITSFVTKLRAKLSARS